MILVEMLVMLASKERSEQDFAELFSRTEFKLTRTIPTACGLSIIEGVPV